MIDNSQSSCTALNIPSNKVITKAYPEFALNHLILEYLLTSLIVNTANAANMIGLVQTGLSV